MLATVNGQLLREHGVPFALDEHLERLASSAAAIALELEGDGIRADIEQLLAAIPPGGQST